MNFGKRAVPLLMYSNLRTSSGSSTDDTRITGVMMSPSPSPVFTSDDDSRDSGYGEGTARASATSTLPDDNIFLRPANVVNSHERRLNSKENKTRVDEAEEDDGIFEAMQMDEMEDVSATVSEEPLAALLHGQIVYEGDRQPAFGTSAITDAFTVTPLKRKKHVGRLRRCPTDLQDAMKQENEEMDELSQMDLDDNDQPELKRHKSLAGAHFTSLREPLKSISLNRSHSENEAFFSSPKEDNCVIGDHSMPHSLPILDRPRVHDLKCISSETLRRLINGEFSHVICDYTLVDCRYPYEYEGGRIKDALNIYTQEQLISHLFNASMIGSGASTSHDSSKRRIYVFYCEYSQERGPRMTRYLRKRDRQLNEHQYPKLFYPEVYLLDGGYKNFYATCSDLCEPRSYRSMHDEHHLNELRKFRCKSKSWCGGGAGFANENANMLGRRPGLNRGLFTSKGD